MMQTFCTCVAAVQASFQMNNHDAESNSADQQFKKSGSGATNSGATMEDSPAYWSKEEEG